MKSSHLSKIEAASYIVGDASIVLSGYYDPDQEWLPFMAGTIFRNIVKKDKTPEFRPNKEAFYKITDSDRQLYSYDREYSNQSVLPFPNFKRVTNNQFKKLKAQGLGTWEKDRSGNLMIIEINSDDDRDSILDWCNENCNYRFHYSKGVLILESALDAVIAKLRFT